MNDHAPMKPEHIEARRLESGYWHIRGEGPCNWAQVECWPCSEEALRKGAFPEASEAFIRSALRSQEKGTTTP